MDDVIADYARECYAALETWSRSTHAGNPRAREELRRLGTLDEAQTRWRNDLNGGDPNAGHTQ